MENELYCDFDHDVTRPKGRINDGVSCAAPDGDEQRGNHLPLGRPWETLLQITLWSGNRLQPGIDRVPAIPKMFPGAKSTGKEFHNSPDGS